MKLGLLKIKAVGIICLAMLLVNPLYAAKSNNDINTEIESRLNKLATHTFTSPEVEQLSTRTKQLLTHLIEAAIIMDALYMQQRHPLNPYWINTLRTRAQDGDKSAEQLLKYFVVSHGPWDVFTQEWILPKTLFPEVKPLEGFNVYPIRHSKKGDASVSKEELDAWLSKHPEDEAAFKSPFTVIKERTDKPGYFYAVPYSIEYQEPLETAAWHLEQAVRYTRDRKIKKLLRSRAQAFRDNNYNDTEIFWIKTHDTVIQLLIGPYEESIDDIWGVKRGFGARVGLKDPEGTADLASYKQLGSTFQKNLPIESKFAPDKQKPPFFTVWRQIFTSGDARSGAQTLGQKLTNDRSVTIKHGARQSFYRNSQEGKCEKILKPISEQVLVQEQQKYVSCDSFFKATLHHEYAHALGVAFWYPNWDKPDANKRKEINANLPTWGGKLEELKADTLGYYNRHYMIDNGLEKAQQKDWNLKMEMFASMVAGYFRSVRFGLHVSYALNAMIQLNHMLDEGAIVFDKKEDGRVRIIPEKVPAVLKANANRALMLQVGGDDNKVAELYKNYAVIRPSTNALLSRVASAGIPNDIYPIFPALVGLRSGNN